jgi:hypothetical protein
MRRALGVCVAASALGCFSTTWRELGPADTPAKGMVVVTGALHFEPPLELHSSGGLNVILVGPMADHVVAYFSDSLEGRFDSGESPPFPGATTAWLPMEGPFAIELPPTVRYLRGYAYVSNRGSSVIELPVRLDLRPGDKAVEVGAITLVRTPPRKIIVRPNPPGGAKRTVRLADPGL